MDSILNYERSEEDDFYAILGCDERSTIEQINAEYKHRVLHCHPDKHPGDQAAAERFSRLQRAKCVLSDAEERGRYDTWRRAGICMPYKQWRGLRDNVHMSMHWGVRAMTDPMLESGPTTSGDHHNVDEDSTSRQIKNTVTTQPDTIPWHRDTPSESLRRFRNYEI